MLCSSSASWGAFWETCVFVTDFSSSMVRAYSDTTSARRTRYVFQSSKQWMSHAVKEDKEGCGDPFLNLMCRKFGRDTKLVFQHFFVLFLQSDMHTNTQKALVGEMPPVHRLKISDLDSPSCEDKGPHVMGLDEGRWVSKNPQDAYTVPLEMGTPFYLRVDSHAFDWTTWTPRYFPPIRTTLVKTLAAPPPSCTRSSYEVRSRSGPLRPRLLESVGTLHDAAGAQL